MRETMEMTIRLADGADWDFAGPEEVAAEGPAAQAELQGLLTAIAESEDDYERRLGELALAIFLLGLDRDLGPDDYTRLLSFPPGAPDADALRADFQALAQLHAEAARSWSEDALAPPRHFRLPAFGFSRGKSRWMSRY
jgi:hypothetical protein